MGNVGRAPGESKGLNFYGVPDSGITNMHLKLIGEEREEGAGGSSGGVFIINEVEAE